MRSAPYLLDAYVGVGLLPIEIHGDDGLLDAFPVDEARSAELDVVGVPLPEAVVRIVGRLALVDHRAHAVLGAVAIQHLDLEAVLEVHAAVAARLHDQELDVQAEVAEGLPRHDVGGAVLAAHGHRIIGHQHRAGIDGVGDDPPLDGQARCETRPLPVGPLVVQHGPRTVEQHLGTGDGRGADADLGASRPGGTGEQGRQAMDGRHGRPPDGDTHAAAGASPGQADMRKPLQPAIMATRPRRPGSCRRGGRR